MRYGWKYGVPAYLAASFVGWNRAEGHPEQHYWHDVFAGAVVGVLPSYTFTTPYHQVTITPVAGNGQIGVLLTRFW